MGKTVWGIELSGYNMYSEENENIARYNKNEQQEKRQIKTHKRGERIARVRQRRMLILFLEKLSKQKNKLSFVFQSHTQLCRRYAAALNSR